MESINENQEFVPEEKQKETEQSLENENNFEPFEGEKFHNWYPESFTIDPSSKFFLSKRQIKLAGYESFICTSNFLKDFERNTLSSMMSPMFSPSPVLNSRSMDLIGLSRAGSIIAENETVRRARELTARVDTDAMKDRFMQTKFADDADIMKTRFKKMRLQESMSSKIDLLKHTRLADSVGQTLGQISETRLAGDAEAVKTRVKKMRLKQTMSKKIIDIKEKAEAQLEPQFDTHLSEIVEAPKKKKIKYHADSLP